MLYRICTEDKNRRAVTDILDQQFDGYTLYTVEGRWKGKAEDALVIEIDNIDISDEHMAIKIHTVVKAIKKANNQEAVLLQKVSAVSLLVYDRSLV